MPLEEVWWSSDQKLLKPSSPQVSRWCQLSCPALCLSPEAFKPLTFWYSVPNFCLIFHRFVLWYIYGMSAKIFKYISGFLCSFRYVHFCFIYFKAVALCVYVYTYMYTWDAYSLCVCVIPNNFPYSKVPFACLLVATTSFFLFPLFSSFLPLTVSCYIHVYTRMHIQIQHPKTLRSEVLGLQVCAKAGSLFNTNSSDPVLMSGCWHTFPDLSLCVLTCAVRSENLVDNTWSYLALEKTHSQYCCLFVMC